MGTGDEADSAKRAKRAKRESIRQAEEEVIGKPVEQAIAFDVAGNEVLRKAGTADDVPLSPQEQLRMRDAIIIHNHPTATLPGGAVVRNLPPSAREDLDILLGCEAKEIRVITDDYRFILKRKPDPRYSTPATRMKVVRQQWTRQYNRLRRQRLGELQRDYGVPLSAAVGLDFIEKISEDAHRTWLLVSKKARLHYRRESR